MTDPINVVTAAAPAGGGYFCVAASRRASTAPAAPGTETAPPAKTGSAADAIASAVDALQRYAESAGAELSFRVDDEHGRVIVTVQDRRDGTVLRQIPSEEVLRISRMLDESAANLVQEVA